MKKYQSGHMDLQFLVYVGWFLLTILIVLFGGLGYFAFKLLMVLLGK